MYLCQKKTKEICFRQNELKVSKGLFIDQKLVRNRVDRWSSS